MALGVTFAAFGQLPLVDSSISRDIDFIRCAGQTAEPPKEEFDVAMNSGMLASLGEVAKPAAVLIEKVSNAIGGVFEPFQIKRIARAEAEAALIQAEGEVKVEEIHRRAFRRFLQEEALRQTNMETITAGAFEHLNENALPEKIEDDWITGFFEECRVVSNEEMQILWSRLLAGEANSPGSFAKRTVRLLGDLDTSDARLFTRLCGFTWQMPDPMPLVWNERESIYNENGVNFSSLGHLESLGLARTNTLSGFQKIGLGKALPVSYFGRAQWLIFPKDSGNNLAIGKVLFTQAGRELWSVCGATEVDGFFDYCRERWSAKSLIMGPAPNESDSARSSKTA